jgi:hypothetical protein
MEFGEKVRTFIAESEWDNLSTLIDKKLDSIKDNLASSCLSKEEKIAYINKQLADNDWLANLIGEQKKDIEQQLLCLKRSKVARQLYTSSS